jgi:hypothetical protein
MVSQKLESSLRYEPSEERKRVEIGATFGRLRVFREPSSRDVRRRWLCYCECGNAKKIRTTEAELQGRRKVSCGCVRKEASDSEYRSWLGMKRRCDHEDGYKGRVQIYEPWRHSFECFILDMGSKPFSNYTIDRIDGNEHYEPPNCRWVSRREQNLNTSRTVTAHAHNKRMPVSEWAKITGISAATIRSRLRSGWDEEAAITTPVRGR